jgi:endonuclease-3
MELDGKQRRGRLKEAQDVSNLRRKTRKVVRLLENNLGIPHQPSSLPPPLDTLVATILSQNTNDKNSHRAYRSLKQRFSTWDRVAKAPLRRVKSAIRGGGMANQKAPRIRQILNQVIQRYGRAELSSLRTKTDDEILAELTDFDGVGVKTASCVLLFSLGRDVFPVDTHVHRICTRLGLVPGKGGPEKTFASMRSLVPRGKGYSFHTNLIRFGRRVCRSSFPACGNCPLYGECVYPHKELHPRRVKASRTDHEFMLLDNVS